MRDPKQKKRINETNNKKTDKLCLIFDSLLCSSSDALEERVCALHHLRHLVIYQWCVPFVCFPFIRIEFYSSPSICGNVWQRAEKKSSESHAINIIWRHWIIQKPIRQQRIWPYLLRARDSQELSLLGRMCVCVFGIRIAIIISWCVEIMVNGDNNNEKKTRHLYSGQLKLVQTVEPYYKWQTNYFTVDLAVNRSFFFRQL